MVVAHDLVAGPRPPPQEPQHLGVGVELHLELEVLVGKGDEVEASGLQGWLRHHPTVPHLRPARPPGEGVASYPDVGSEHDHRRAGTQPQ